MQHCQVEVKRDAVRLVGKDYLTYAVVAGRFGIRKAKGAKDGWFGLSYSNAEQRVVAGHFLFTRLYALLDQRCPLEPKMYCQIHICEQESQLFQSKVVLAVETIETFEPVGVVQKGSLGYTSGNLLAKNIPSHHISGTG